MSVSDYLHAERAVADVFEGRLLGDLPFLPQAEDDIVHQAHPLADTGFHRISQPRRFPVPYEVRDGHVVHHDLAGHHEAAARRWEEPLADDAAEALGNAR